MLIIGVLLIAAILFIVFGLMRRGGGFPFCRGDSEPRKYWPSDAVMDAIASGKKIEAIKLIREESGLGLAESTEICKQIEAGNYNPQ